MAVTSSSSSPSDPSKSPPFNSSSTPEESPTHLETSSSTPEPPPSTAKIAGHVNGAALGQGTDSIPLDGQTTASSSTPSLAIGNGTVKDPVSEHSSPRVSRKDDQTNFPENDKPEDASMSPTLTPNKSSSAHDTSPSSAKANGVKPPGARSPKAGFFSRLFRVLVPCVSPSSTTHPVDIDIDVPRSPEPSSAKQDTQAEVVIKEEEAPKSTEQAPAPLETQQGPLLTEKQAEEKKEPVVEQESADDRAAVEEPTVLVPPSPTLLPEAETEGLTSGAVQAPGSTGQPPSPAEKTRDGDESDHTSFTEDDLDEVHVLDEDEEEDRLILNGGAGIPLGPDGVPRPLLPPISPQHAGRKCLVLDLDETLVHSSFKSIQQADYVVPVEIEYHWHNVYVIKRPGVDNFLKKMGEIYEVVIFTASLSKYADPVLDKLDIHQVVSHRLFRESCYNHKGNYVKDLSQLGRPITDTIILDNSPASYIFHPNNAVPVSSWFNDPHDTELTDLVPFLTDLSAVDDVRGILDGAR